MSNYTGGTKMFVSSNFKGATLDVLLATGQNKVIGEKVYKNVKFGK